MLGASEAVYDGRHIGPFPEHQQLEVREIVCNDIEIQALDYRAHIRKGFQEHSRIL